MASLEPEKKRAWKEALSATSSPWVVCGIKNSENELSAKLEGMAGLIDWAVHGQVSLRLLKSQLTAGESCVVPGDSLRHRPSFLFFPVGVASGPQLLAEKARKLKITELALAESTFPEDFLAKVKQTLKKEGIRCKILEEPET